MSILVSIDQGLNSTKVKEVNYWLLAKKEEQILKYLSHNIF